MAISYGKKLFCLALFPCGLRVEGMRLTVTMLIAVVMFLGCTPSLFDSTGLSDIFDLLEQQGYTANVGLSGIYEPGNLVQTTQEGSDGKPVALQSPIIFAWGSDCFPDRAPRIAPFVLSSSHKARRRTR